MTSGDLLAVSASSNARPLVIFVSYMALCASLTILIIRTLHKKRKDLSMSSSVAEHTSSSAKRMLFALLAIFSLVTTWYYMFSFFQFSYQAWASTNRVTSNTGEMQFGNWLRDTKLFKEAWHTALATPARFWWTQQIFFFSVGWSIFLHRQGRRFDIPHLWAFMLLGQVVAISFATNLFFLTVLFYRTRMRSQPTTKQDPATTIDSKPSISTYRAALLLASLVLTFIAVTAIPYTLTSPYFLTILIVPHALLFIPPLLNQMISGERGTSSAKLEAKRWYARVYEGIMVCAALLQAKATFSVVQEGSTEFVVEGYGQLLEALYEHPAVSSVGWDVIFCWVSWGVWIVGERSKLEEDKTFLDGGKKEM